MYVFFGRVRSHPTLNHVAITTAISVSNIYCTRQQSASCGKGSDVDCQRTNADLPTAKLN